MRHSNFRTLVGILCALALLGLAAWSWARTTVVVVGQGAAAGGTPATGNYRPNADVSRGSWSDNDYESTDLYTDIDDAVTTGNAGDGAVVREWETMTTYEIGMAEVTGSITSVRIHIRSSCSKPSGSLINVSISRDGSTWSSIQTVVPGYSDTFTWAYTTFTGLAWDGTTDFRVRVAQTDDSVVLIDVLYAEVNPS